MWLTTGNGEPGAICRPAPSWTASRGTHNYGRRILRRWHQRGLVLTTTDRKPAKVSGASKAVADGIANDRTAASGAAAVA